MTPQLELCADEVRPLLGENTDFTVVGVLGCQGVGKSTIMSLLAGAGWRGGGSDAAADTAADSMAGGGAELANPPFPPNPPEAWARGAHGTSGVDVQVTAERLILLDTQPLLSASLLLSMTGSPVPPSVHSHENLLEVQALQLCALLLSVCHVVLLVQDAAADEGLWSSAAAGMPSASEPPLVFALPCASERAPTSSHAGYRHEAEQLRDAVLGLPRRPFARSLSERDWLRGVVKLWELVRRSPTLDEYNRATHKLHQWA
ncbi:hypothetical protein EMIHUDRAFT_242275 [Emiliania huxleyi CCMP1516]|uniref:Protein SMG9 n=2 Tax=Emiliania huxleyi TaxID=2903 RepID=A0A0D3J9R1_EMIH1|nr:hypothetical protein EMIHUDRAFT_197402 [Emiliania huxleyi CCMP1516]XP_005772675.1 hypothetical protein EMIHUDRAFT_242275 [Emiliania huxleyi CCMP1516]EOD14824.1 hypothetical protein EMIHUDRAFT_197402 [Emiliania huxleyi CCMP1516]EOD20246.1 hypothetical protein EMIHUDRAFT_242275 [Emiliania huxleyi CCMP1516]|eukprot:XP_005767253.1 hypothetical protein EMIHUDRAFT_197402 [Emiliania huxleyi CCMP1516]